MLNDPHADFKAAAQAIRESIAELSQRIDHLLVLGGEVKQLALKRLPSGQIVGRCEVGTYGELLTDPDDRCNTVLNWTVPAGVSIPAHSHAQCESTYILTGELYDAESGTIYRAGELMQLYRAVPGFELDCNHSTCNNCILLGYFSVTDVQ